MRTPPSESIWGNVNTCIEIGLEIYQLCSKTHSGIAIPIDKAKSLLSEKALSYGVQKDGFVYFENSDKLLAPLFELLKCAAITDKGYIDSVGGIKGVKAELKNRIPEYFGQSEPPVYPPPTIGKKETAEELTNGAWLINGENIYVHRSFALYGLSEAAARLGGKDGEYLLYEGALAAVPLFELSKTSDTARNVIVSEDSLHATLCGNFPEYVKSHNMSALPNARIKDADAPPYLFMQSHLDNAAEAPGFYEYGDSGFEVLGDDELVPEIER